MKIVIIERVTTYHFLPRGEADIWVIVKSSIRVYYKT